MMVSAMGKGSVSESALQGAINKIWSALKIESGDVSFDFAKRMMSRESVFAGFVYNNVTTVLQSLWIRVLSKMSMEAEDGTIIPNSTTRFAEGFGWSKVVDEAFNPSVKEPRHSLDKKEFVTKRWIVIEDLAQAGLDVRHSSSHHHTPQQVESKRTRGAAKARQTGIVTSAPFARKPFPIDIFFAYAVFGALIAGRV
jgi:hypothetical protein